jgi:hypothetical protein
MKDMPKEIECTCGGVAVRYISKAPLFHLDPISGDHPGATRAWEKGREKQIAKEKKNMENHGTY